MQGVGIGRLVHAIRARRQMMEQQEAQGKDHQERQAQLQKYDRAYGASPPRPGALGRRKDGGIGAVRAWYPASVALPAEAPPAALDHPHVIAAIDAGRGLTNQGYTFLTAGGREEFLSWDGLRSEVMNGAAHLRALGLRPGDCLAIVMPDGRDFVPTFLGAAWAGVIPVPLYPPPSLGKVDAYLDALVAIMNAVDPPHLAIDAKLGTLLGSVAARVPSVKGTISAEALRTEAPPPSGAGRPTSAPTTSPFCSSPRAAPRRRRA